MSTVKKKNSIALPVKMLLISLFTKSKSLKKASFYILFINLVSFLWTNSYHLHISLNGVRIAFFQFIVYQFRWIRILSVTEWLYYCSGRIWLIRDCKIQLPQHVRCENVRGRQVYRRYSNFIPGRNRRPQWRWPCPVHSESETQVGSLPVPVDLATARHWPLGLSTLSWSEEMDPCDTPVFSTLTPTVFLTHADSHYYFLKTF